MSEYPALKARLEPTPDGATRLALEISIVGESHGAVAVLVDLSDSVDVTPQDFHRLRRLLQALPRSWGVFLDAFGPALADRPTATVADIVDGVIDLPGMFLRPDAVRQRRGTGSFLGPAMRRFREQPRFESVERRIAFVLTDGALVDLEPLASGNWGTIIGVGLTRSSFNAERWHQVVPDAECLAPDRTDAGKVVRELAGTRFSGTCRVDVPGAAFRYRAAHVTPTEPGTDPVKGPIDWVFGLGNLLIEIPATVGSPFPERVTIREEAGDEVSLPVQVIGGEHGASGPNEASVPAVANGVDVVPGEHAQSLSALLEDLVTRKLPWQADDGSLPDVVKTLPAVSSWLDGSGHPCCAGLVLVIPPLAASGSDGIPILAIALSDDRENAFIAGTVLGDQQGFRCETTHELSFHRLDARWVFRCEAASSKSLPPRNSVSIADSCWKYGDEQCRVFFSGPLRSIRSV